MRVSGIVTSLSIFALLAGCQGSLSVGEQSSMCSEAAAHVADCEGGDPVAVTSCDSAQSAAAESVVNSSCAQLASGVGKSDGVDGLCVALVLPLFATHIAPGGLCCLGYQCEGDANTCISHRCGPRLSVGAKCSANNDCKSGLTCLPSGKCGAPLPEGAACKEKEDCIDGLTCGASQLCAEAAADGATCTSNDQCINRCILGSCASASSEGGSCDDVSDCDGFMSCVNNTCTRPVSGAACKGDYDCAGIGLTCQFGTCSAQPKTGERCDTASTFGCASSDDSCFDNVCRPKVGTGGACVKIFDCKQGLCRDGVCG